MSRLALHCPTEPLIYKNYFKNRKCLLNRHHNAIIQSPAPRQSDNCQTVKNRTMESVSNYKNQTNASQIEIVEEKVDAYIVIPPDGGWGWIIVMSAFTAFLISDGIFFSFGIFLQEWSDTFKCTKSQVALTGALMTGFSCLAGKLY